jgi:hypothetical protein
MSSNRCPHKWRWTLCQLRWGHQILPSWILHLGANHMHTIGKRGHGKTSGWKRTETTQLNKLWYFWTQNSVIKIAQVPKTLFYIFSFKHLVWMNSLIFIHLTLFYPLWKKYTLSPKIAILFLSHLITVKVPSHLS